MGQERDTLQPESHFTSFPGVPRSGPKLPRVATAKPIDPRPTPGYVGEMKRMDGVLRDYADEVQQVVQISTATSKRPRTLPLYLPKGGPYNTLWRFRHPFQRTGPHSRPARAGVTPVHLHGLRLGSCPRTDCWNCLREVNNEHSPLRVSSTSL